MENRGMRQRGIIAKQCDSPALISFVYCQNCNYVFILNLTAH